MENESASARGIAGGPGVNPSLPAAQSAGDDDLFRDPVEVLAAEFVDRHRSGECPGIEEYALKYPEHADEIRDLFPMIASLENLKLQRERSSGGVASTGLPCLKKLGDFRIIGEIGRGGMGIVYEAEQLSLRRLVALKVLGAQIANSARQLKRFRREAEAAARLHHTNIVPIFAIGEEDSIHYYAMQFINGPTLAELIDQEAIDAGISRPQGDKSHGDGRLRSREGGQDEVIVTETVIDQSSSECHQTPLPLVVEYKEPSGAGRPPKQFVGTANTGRHAEVHKDFQHDDWRAMARIGAQLADALSYAHDQGVLHRDIKPANVLIDTDGLSWLADFGLAKHEDQDGVTHSGDIVGTLRFMAPEQFHGKCDGRSDIYSLGLTLYEVLTLRPAFDESRYAPLLQLKTTQAPPPPRTLNPRIPRDLETIILKACATEPEHRYQNARELRDDLRRFVDDLPIEARRLTAFEQLWRWARRNPLVASLSTATAVLLMALATVLAVGQYKAQKAIVKIEEAKFKAEANLRIADAEAERAAANLSLALAALDRIFQNLSTRGLPQSLNVELEDGDTTAIPFSTVTAADAILLEDLVQFFNKFAEQNAANLKEETAKAFVRIGDIQDRLGQPAAAEVAYRKALRILLEQWRTTPGSVPLNLQIAEVWNDIGVASSIGGDTLEAIQAHENARGLLTSLAFRTGDDDVKFALAQTNNLLNSAMVRSGSTELVAALAQRVGESGTSGSRREGEPRREGGDRDRDPDEERRRNTRGRGFPFDAREAYSSAVDLLRQLIQKHPERSDFRLALARSFRSRTRMMDSGNQEAMHEAEYAGLESISILEQLVVEDPKNVSYRSELADTYCLVAQRLKEYPLQDRFEWLNKAIEITGELQSQYPFVPDYQALQAGAFRGLAKLEAEENQFDTANSHFEKAALLQDQLVHRFPSIRLYLFSNAQTLAEWAALEFDRGNKVVAEEKLNVAIQAIEKSLKSGQDYQNRGHQMFLWRLQGQLAFYRGEPEPRIEFGPPGSGEGTSRPSRSSFGRFGAGGNQRRPPAPPEATKAAEVAPGK